MRSAVALAIVLTLGATVDVDTAPPSWSAEHKAAMRRAAIWIDVPGAATLDPASNPDDRFRPTDEVTCRFDPEPVSGRTPKFDCTLPDGESVKVKYGAANPEVFGEVLASRLLSALGLPTDLASFFTPCLELALAALAPDEQEKRQQDQRNYDDCDDDPDIHYP